jgi:hypothetical protein
VGSHTLGASYGGDTSFLAGSGELVQAVSKAASATTLTASASPSTFGPRRRQPHRHRNLQGRRRHPRQRKPRRWPGHPGLWRVDRRSARAHRRLRR